MKYAKTACSENNACALCKKNASDTGVIVRIVSVENAKRNRSLLTGSRKGTSRKYFDYRSGVGHTQSAITADRIMILADDLLRLRGKGDGEIPMKADRLVRFLVFVTCCLAVNFL